MQPLDLLRRERDLLTRILELARHDSPGAFVAEALGLLTELAGEGSRGYVELARRHGDGVWSACWGFDTAGVEEVRRFLSRTIIAEALRADEVIETVSAQRDDRFAAADSVQRNAIERVLCVPVGSPPLGVIYLQGKSIDANRHPEARALIQLFARHLAPIAGKIVALAAEAVPDPTAPWRARLGGAHELVGTSPALAEALEGAAMVAGLDVPVLITGPSGSGKSALARIIWTNSARRHRPITELNCATLPEALFESELFGAMPGAHSTATRRLTGKVEATHGGTLFLDEIGELALGAQAKLLQLLQDKRYFALGGTQALDADVRIIAATNRDLDERVRSGAFRADLLYRLRVLPLTLPGLDARRGDIARIAQALLAQVTARHGLDALTLRPAALTRLTQHDWPGHVRELGNCVEAGAIRAHSDGSTFVEVTHLFPERHRAGAPEREPTPMWQDATRAFQRRLLQDTLDAHAGNVAEAARALGIARSHAYELVRQLGARRP